MAPVIPMSHEEQQAAQKSIDTLIQKGALIPWNSMTPGVCNNIFLRPKKDGGWRMILNLKHFNDYIEKIHFKMEILNSVLQAVTPGCYIAKLDFQDAFHGVVVHPDFWPFLTFDWKGKMYTYTCMPFRLTSAPRVYTKLLKPLLSTLRQDGIVLFIYLDDSWIRNQTFQLCLQDVHTTLDVVLQLGLLHHPEKSAPVPMQVIEFLGFIVDSVKMIITLSAEKTSQLLQLCQHTIEHPHMLCRELARIIGKIVAAFLASPRGRAHYRHLERLKQTTLAYHNDNFDAPVTLNFRCVKMLRWWIHTLPTTSAPIQQGQMTITIYTDACDDGWGAFLQDTIA